jgi:hypothetical protein
MPLGRLDLVQAIVLHASLFDWLDDGYIRRGAAFRAAEGLGSIIDVL